jgi:hypothetical protein
VVSNIQELFEVSANQIESELTLYQYGLELCFWVLKAGPFNIIVGANPGGFHAWLGSKDGYSGRQIAKVPKGVSMRGFDRFGYE